MLSKSIFVRPTEQWHIILPVDSDKDDVSLIVFKSGASGDNMH